MVFFTDTNLFLQCKPISELDWALVTDDNEITVYVTRPVLEEIDKLKNDGNRRRSKRARSANSWFGSLFSAGKHECIEHVANPTVRIVLGGDPLPRDMPDAEGRLDLGKNDHRIVSSLKHYIETHIGGYASLLTYDNGPIGLCHCLELPFTTIPEAWLLPPEKDERDKKILKLEKVLKEYQSRQPCVSAEVIIAGRAMCSSRSAEQGIQITQFLHLSEEEVQELVEIKQAQFPSQEYHDFGVPLPIEVGDSEEKKSLKEEANRLREKALAKVSAYRTTEYPNWLKKLREYYSEYSTAKSDRNRVLSFSIALRNTGSIPVDKMILGIRVLKGGVLMSPYLDEKHSMKDEMPDPPEPPEAPIFGEYTIEMARFASLFPPRLSEASIIEATQKLAGSSTLCPGPTRYRDLSESLSLAESRDPNAFYWRDGKPTESTTNWEFTCDEYRHKEKPEMFTYMIQLDELGETGKLVVEISASGRNLPDPFCEVFAVRIQVDMRSVYEEVRAK